MQRKLIVGGIVCVALIVAAVSGVIAYRRSEGYLIGVATGAGDSKERLAAIEALYYRHDRNAMVPLLIKLLGDSSPETSAKATKFLGSIGDSRAIDPLLAMFDAANDESEARRIAESLPNFGAEVVPTLINRLSNAKPAVRAASAAALGWMASGLFTDGQRDRDAIFAAMGRGAIEPLIALLRDPVAFVRTDELIRESNAARARLREKED